MFLLLAAGLAKKHHQHHTLGRSPLDKLKAPGRSPLDMLKAPGHGGVIVSDKCKTVIHGCSESGVHPCACTGKCQDGIDPCHWCSGEAAPGVCLLVSSKVGGSEPVCKTIIRGCT